MTAFAWNESRVQTQIRWAQRGMFGIAFLLFGYCGFVIADSWMFQRSANRDLDRLVQQSDSQTAGALARAQLNPGSLIGRIDVDRLGVSSVVVEGTDESALGRAAGHIAGTALPGEIGNVAIAAHRDTYFRPLRNIRTKDVIRITTPQGIYRYRVVSTAIVTPDNLAVLQSTDREVLTLVTCYPFSYVGPAPNRFVVRAEKITGPAGDAARKRLATRPPDGAS